MKRAVWALTIAALANYALLIWYGTKVLEGEKALDLYVTGYSHDQVMALLSNLRPDMIDRLVNEVRLIDTGFPILCGLAMAGWMWIAAEGRGLVRGVATLVPLGFTGFDLYEKHLVAEMLINGAPSVEQVFIASSITVIKFALFGASIILLIWFAIRRRKH